MCPYLGLLDVRRGGWQDDLVLHQANAHDTRWTHLLRGGREDRTPEVKPKLLCNLLVCIFQG